MAGPEYGGGSRYMTFWGLLAVISLTRLLTKTAMIRNHLPCQILEQCHFLSHHLGGPQIPHCLIDTVLRTMLKDSVFNRALAFPLKDIHVLDWLFAYHNIVSACR